MPIHACTCKHETKVRKLAAEILQDGFVTSGDPLLVVRNPELEHHMRNMDAPWALGPGQQGVLLPFTLGYMKGKARMFTLLTILSLAVDDHVELEKAWQGAGGVSRGKV